MSAPIIPLGEATDILSGFAFNSKHFNKTKGIPIIRIRDVTRGYSDTRYDGPFDPAYLVSDGDMLIGMDGEFNIAPWSGGEALLNQRVCKISARDASKLNERYLLHFLPKQLKLIEDKTPFVTVKHLSVKGIRAIELPLPPLATQQRIADTLDAADALRRKDQKLLWKYDELAQSIFHEMFGELNTHNGDYPVVHLRDLADSTSGITKNARLKPEDMVEVPYLRVANVQDGYLNLGEIKTITAGARDVAKYQLQKGDIVITEGGDPDKLGRGTVWNEEVAGCSFQNHIFRIRVFDNRITPYFLSKVIGSKYGKAYFLKAAKQTTGIATINSSQLKAFPVILPPKHLQVEYEAKMERLAAQKQLVVGSAAASSVLMQTLLQSSFA